MLKIDGETKIMRRIRILSTAENLVITCSNLVSCPPGLRYIKDSFPPASPVQYTNLNNNILFLVKLENSSWISFSAAPPPPSLQKSNLPSKK